MQTVIIRNYEDSANTIIVEELDIEGNRIKVSDPIPATAEFGLGMEPGKTYVITIV